MKSLFLLMVLALPLAAHPHTVCTPTGTKVIEGDSNWKNGIERGWWLDGPCPDPEPTPQPPPRPVPPPPVPLPLLPSPIRPGPVICKAFGDVTGVDVLVITNVTERPALYNVWKYRDSGELFETSSFDLGPRAKVVINVDTGFNGWWRVTGSEMWKGARQRLDVSRAIVLEREATPCLE